MPKIVHRTTLGDIAKKTGMHLSTISLALRDSPKIPEDTRDKIKTVAAELGYSPDPMLKALSIYRTSTRPRPFQATLAWINSHPKRTDPSLTMLNEMHAAAEEYSKDLGYKLEEFWVNQPSLQGPARLSRILRSRGIQGLLFAPQPKPDASFELEWDDFSAITFGYSLTRPQLHLAINHQYRTMRRILTEIRALGYKRIGLCLSHDYDKRVDHNWSAGFWVDYAAQPRSARVSPLLYPNSASVTRNAFGRWLKANRPDVIVTGDTKLANWLEDLGLSIPGEIGFSAISLLGNERHFSGAYENNKMVARAGVDFLINLLHRGERGIPDVPQRVLIDCIWLPGKTLRRVGGAD